VLELVALCAYAWAFTLRAAANDSLSTQLSSRSNAPASAKGRVLEGGFLTAAWHREWSMRRCFADPAQSLRVRREVDRWSSTLWRALEHCKADDAAAHRPRESDGCCRSRVYRAHAACVACGTADFAGSPRGILPAGLISYCCGEVAVGGVSMGGADGRIALFLPTSCRCSRSSARCSH